MWKQWMKKPDQNSASVVSYKDIDAVERNGQAFIECTCVQATNINRIEYNHDKLYSIVRKLIRTQDTS